MWILNFQKNKQAWASALLLAALGTASVSAAPSLENLESAFERQQWDETVEIAHEMLHKDPKAPLPKLRAAYALFQKGYPNAALFFLRRLTPEQWREVPAGQDRLVEIISLFQKKVPLSALPGKISQVRVEDASVHLKDEIRFSLGREALEKGDLKTAETYLSGVGTGSRFWSEARYLLATVAVKEKNYTRAAEEFSRSFDTGVLAQSTEFWRDFTTNATSHWGSSLKVMLDTDALTQNNRVGELSVLGLARVAYATKQYEKALNEYDRLPKDSRHYAKRSLERVWTLLNLNRHADAERAAADLSSDENSFESIKARPLRALILTDAGKTKDARRQLDDFLSYYEKLKTATVKFRASLNEGEAPSFMKGDLDDDARLRVLKDYNVALKGEIEKLRNEDRRLYPVFSFLAQSLDALVTEARTRRAKLLTEHISRRLGDLEKLYVQAKLIKAETYLEDREKLRTEFKNVGETEAAKQQAHDERLVEILESAVGEVDETTAKTQRRHLQLEFRQSELLWELASARGILYQTTQNPRDREVSEQLKLRSLQLAEGIVKDAPNFKKHPQALFFVGYALIELQKEAEGVRTLRNYVSRYPKHDHVPDAYRILGDIAFDAGQYGAAEMAYRRILEFNESPVMGYALYKIGWCAYNQKNYSKALLGLEQAILWADQWEKSKQLLTLEREARRDLVSMYAEVGDVKKASDYFQRFLRGESTGWLIELAKQLDNSGQYEKSAELYRTLISLDPGSPDNITYQTAIIWGAFKLHQWPRVLEATRELTDRYRVVFNTPQAPEHPAAHAEKTLREILLSHYQEYVKTSGKEETAQQKELDELYLNSFYDWKEAQSPLYTHGHFLLKQKDSVGATIAFRNHWKRFEKTITPELREEALRNLIHALEELESKEKDPGTQLSANALELLAYIDEYRTAYPTTKYIRAISYLGSALFFKYREQDRGIEASQRIFDFNPRDEFGKKAFKNLRVAYYNKKDWEKTYRWATELYGRKFPGMEIYAEDLKTIRGESLFLWAENTVDNETSGGLFMQISLNSEMQKLWEKSLYNAFIRYQKAGKKIEALTAAHKLEDLFPNFPKLPEVAGMRAAMHQESGDYVAALPQLLFFLAKAPADIPRQTVAQGRLNAGLISEALGKDQEALNLFTAYRNDRETSTPAGAEEAARAMQRIRVKGNRALASLPNPKWGRLVQAKTEFERMPLAKNGELADRIQGGAQRLEQLAKQFIDISSNADIDESTSFEAFCAVPFLYNAYEKAVGDIASRSEQSVATELQKITTPIAARAKELGEECLKKSHEAEHDGPIYRQVNQRWGWGWDPILTERIKKLIAEMQTMAPWLDPSPYNVAEEDLIKLHLQDRGNADTWYALAKLRCDERKIGLCKLTLMDALTKNPNSGRLLNALAVLTEGEANAKGLVAPYTKAGKLGSPRAWANLALYHFKGARYYPGIEALRQAKQSKVFENNERMRLILEEWVKR